MIGFAIIRRPSYEPVGRVRRPSYPLEISSLRPSYSFNSLFPIGYLFFNQDPGLWKTESWTVYSRILDYEVWDVGLWVTGYPQSRNPTMRGRNSDHDLDGSSTVRDSDHD